MGWNEGSHHTRSKKLHGRVVRDYIGSRQVAELAAKMDAINRQVREAKHDALRIAKAEVDELDTPLNEVNELNHIGGDIEVWRYALHDGCLHVRRGSILLWDSVVVVVVLPRHPDCGEKSSSTTYSIERDGFWTALITQCANCWTCWASPTSQSSSSSSASTTPTAPAR